MKITKTDIEGVFVIEPKIIGDERGWLCESYRVDTFAAEGIDAEFVKDIQTFSSRAGTLRGLHFQNHPFAVSKLVRCARGKVFDVAVDLRPWSKTYKKNFTIILDGASQKQVFIPRGVAHGFLSLEDNCEIMYKYDNYYNPKCDRSVRFDDPEFKIKWPKADYILSKKDADAPLLRDSDANFNARVLVTGAGGQLGFDMVKKLKSIGVMCLGIDRAECDISNFKSVEKVFKNFKPTAVVHCAAYTAVDKAETEREICFAANVTGTKNIAECAKKTDATMIHISTDFVYDTAKGEILTETSPTKTVNYYAETKLNAEEIVQKTMKKYYILRTNWVFGTHGNNFVKSMLSQKTNPEISMVDDQVGSPTYTVDMANLIAEMIFSNKFGVYNVSNTGHISKAEFAEAILGRKIRHIKTADFKSAAERPLCCATSKQKIVDAGFTPMPTWQNALERFIKGEQK
jgi:dTDP-4-dehydrorhamnose reductase/dTDP-4-dehydrorhamnose 3,5-epimerase